MARLGRITLAPYLAAIILAFLAGAMNPKGLGLFLGVVRPRFMTAMKSEPAFIGPVLTGIFSRYNAIALRLSVSNLILAMMSTPLLTRLSIRLALTLIPAFKLAFDIVIKRREGAAQIRGIGEEVNG